MLSFEMRLDRVVDAFDMPPMYGITEDRLAAAVDFAAKTLARHGAELALGDLELIIFGQHVVHDRVRCDVVQLRVLDDPVPVLVPHRDVSECEMQRLMGDN